MGCGKSTYVGGDILQKGQDFVLGIFGVLWGRISNLPILGKDRNTANIEKHIWCSGCAAAHSLFGSFFK